MPFPINLTYQIFSQKFLNHLPSLTGKLGQDSDLILRHFLDYRITGIDNIPSKPPFIVTANHPLIKDGFVPLPLDVMLISYIIERDVNKPIRWLVKSNLKTKLPVIGLDIYDPWQTLVRQLFVRRYQGIQVDSFYYPQRRARVLSQAKGLLYSNEVVGIMPEGGAYTTLHKGKKGAAILALNINKERDISNKIPIIPMGAVGMERGISITKKLPCQLNIGRPIYLLGDEDPEQATEEIMYAIADLIPYEYRGVYSA